MNSQSDWEYYLPLVLYAYRTATHTSTGVSPFLLMFGRSSSLPPLTIQNAFTATSYPDYLTAKLAELRDLVDVNLTKAALSHKRAYDQHSANLPQLFAVNDPVWLSIPTAGKLDPRWEGGWIVKSVKNPENIEITNSKTTKVVHINRIQSRHIPSTATPEPTQPNDSKDRRSPAQHWTPPSNEHFCIPAPTPQVQHRYPQRARRPPDRFGW